MHGNSLAPLIRKCRARTSDTYILAALAMLEQVQHDIAAGQRRKACKACSEAYKREKARTKAWWDRTGYRRKPKT